MEKIKIWYVYRVGECGDGCCSWDDSYVEDSRYNEWECHRVMYELNDFREYLRDTYGDDWEDTHEIDVDKCSFY